MRLGGPMADSSSTNGREKGNNTDAGGSQKTTHESGPAEHAPSSSDVDVLERGATVGRYLTLERLGAGAMGVVYAAYDPELDRKVALKFLLRQTNGRDPTRQQARLVREAKAMAKLSHPNVGSIFDVGVHENRVFLAMEYLPGGTLSKWLAAEKRPWRQIVNMFEGVGHGLAAAHAEGLIHRDFKPDNVLLDKAGKPKVVDFGLVRLSGAIEVSDSGPNDDSDLAVAEAVPEASAAGAVALTRTGALAGTPAYMAPEQFLGKPVDARTDQFAFCVALYEALYGERPFAGNSMIAIADSVTAGRIQPAPKNTQIPGWVRACLVKGLRTDAGVRYPGFDDLLAALRNDPVGRLKRRLGVGVAVGAIVGAVVFVQHRSNLRRVELERALALHVSAATQARADADALGGRAAGLRQRALQEFDHGRREEGERIWKEARAVVEATERALGQASSSLDAALTLDKQQPSLRRDLARTLLDQALLTEQQFQILETKRILTRLAALGTSSDLASTWNQPGHLELRADAAGARVSIDEVLPKVGEPYGYRSLGAPRAIPTSLDLAPGTYRFRVQAPGRTSIVALISVVRGSRDVATLTLPKAETLPDGFVYVPAGDTYYGDYDEPLRTSFLDTVPIHRLHVDGFAIAKRETTLGDWIAFLESDAGRGKQQYLPAGGDPTGGHVALHRGAHGWEYEITPWSVSYKVGRGAPLVYRGRLHDAVQSWELLPVTGVSAIAAEAYAHWLQATERVPGARLCSEVEWEHAARGADARLYPNGDLLAPTDANFDESYGHRVELFGLDMVGSHPTSDSPFGVSDMAGNALEITSGSLGDSRYVMRGGSYYQNANTARVTNRTIMTATSRGQSLGLRLCADVTSGNTQ